MGRKLSEIINNIKDSFYCNEDVVFREIKIKDIDAICIYQKGVSDLNQIGQFILKPLVNVSHVPSENLLDYIDKKVLSFPDSKRENDVNKMIDEIMKGSAVLIIDGENDAIILSVNKYFERAISEPPTSTVLSGPRKGFVENLQTNLGCIKEILSTNDLKIKYLKVGEYTKTDVAIVYISSVCDKKLVEKVEKKISKIKIDGVLDSYYITSFLEMKPHSIFKQVGKSEKPDMVCAKLLEGRLAVVVAGSPIVLTLPYILLEDLQSSDDYYSNNIKASILRILRICSIIVTLLLPGLYVAVQLYHYKLIPLPMIITIINTTLGLPLSPFAEMMFVLIIFEILYEASLRMPKYLGIALSVVGALILGDTAVSAGVISPPAVMIVALSGITLYTVPDQAPQFIILRFAFTIVGGCFGLFGLILLTMFIITYLCDLDIYGSPYLSPFAPHIKNDFQDALIKKDLIDITTRPKSIKNKNHRRIKK